MVGGIVDNILDMDEKRQKYLKALKEANDREIAKIQREYRELEYSEKRYWKEHQKRRRKAYEKKNPPFKPVDYSELGDKTALENIERAEKNWKKYDELLNKTPADSPFRGKLHGKLRENAGTLVSMQYPEKSIVDGSKIYSREGDPFLRTEKEYPHRTAYIKEDLDKLSPDIPSKYLNRLRLLKPIMGAVSLAGALGYSDMAGAATDAVIPGGVEEMGVSSEQKMLDQRYIERLKSFQKRDK